MLAPPAAIDQDGAPSVDDWSLLPVPAFGADHEIRSSAEAQIDDPANGGLRREPELPEHEEIVPEQTKPATEFVFGEEDPDDDAVRARVLRQQDRGLARQAAMDPGDGVEL